MDKSEEVNQQQVNGSLQSDRLNNSNDEILNEGFEGEL